MKEKNRFSVLLEHLTSMANLKNYTIAKAVQYDESYISKWISGKLLPAEKNHEIIFQNISECIVNSLNPDTISMFLQEYQVRNLQDLKIAIYDNLEAEYSYVKELRSSTGSEVASKISYYPELTLDQFIFKMKHPSLRKVQALNIYAMVDILNVDLNYQMMITELNGLHNDRGLVLPGVHFSLMIDLDTQNLSSTYIASFLTNVLSNLSNIDFDLYCGSQAQKKMVFAIKDIYSVSGMLVDQSHCLSVTTIEDSSLSTELYHKIRLLCSKDALLIRKTTIENMIRNYEYEHSLFAQNLSSILGHFTENFLPDELYEKLFNKYCSVFTSLKPETLRRLHSITAQLLRCAHIKVMIYTSAFNDFAVTGELDFYGFRIQLTPEQRLLYIKHIDELRKNNAGLELKILPNGVLSDYQHIPRPTLFLSEDFTYLRFEKNTPEYNVCIPNKIVLNKIFKDFFTELWDSDTCVSPDSLITHSIMSMEILQSETSKI